MAKGLDKQKNDKKKGKTLKEKRAAKKEKKKQFFRRLLLFSRPRGVFEIYFKEQHYSGHRTH